MSSDIIWSNQTEEALRDANQFNFEIVSQAGEGIIVYDRDLRYVAWNRFMERMTGVQSEDVLGRNALDLFPHLYEQDVDQLLKRALNGETVSSTDISFYSTFTDQKGWVVGTYAPHRNARGEIIGVIATLQDVTERKLTEKALKESETLQRTLLESLPAGVIIVDPVTRVIEKVNDAATAMFGAPKDQIIGHRCHAFICPASEDACPICDLGKEVDNAEKEILCANGSRCPVLKSVKRVQMQGHEKLLECFLDITDRKKAEEELRQNRDHLEQRVRERTAEMERFIYTVSHDLRSPLVTVSGFVGLLKGDLDKGDSQRAVSDLITISEAITKMDRLLLDTLELSRIGRIASLPAEVPFDQIVREAINQTEGRIESRNVAVYVAEGMPKVRVDVPRIVEVLVNLIENSVKYMGDRDRPEIDIGSRKDGEETVFFIRDNGIGIDSKEHEKVFGLFYKVDRKSEGTGAGLGIVKRIIEVHRGRIWIESELGRGCTVCFTLPLARVA